MAELSELVGRVLDHIGVTEDEVTFFMQDGGAYKLVHHQDCCEDVYIEDIDGDPDDKEELNALVFAIELVGG